MKKKLVLVGNYIDDVDRSEEIDNFDFVVRLNRMNNFGKTGTKTDLLLVDSVQAFWDLYDKEQYKNILSTYVKNIILSDNCDKKDNPKKLRDLISQNLMDNAIHLNLWKYIQEKDKRFNDNRTPQNSFILLYYLIEKYSSEYEIYISNLEKYRSVNDCFYVHENSEFIKLEYYKKWEKENKITFLNNMRRKQKIALCCIYIGKYSILFPDLYKSFKEKFLIDYDRDFFVFTDNKSITNGLDNCITYEISNPCLNQPFILYRKWKYLLMAEDKFLDYDYVCFLNANLRCNKEVKFENIFPNTNKKISAIIHSMIPDLQTGTKACNSVCKYNIEKPFNYYQAGFNMSESHFFLKMCNQIESWRMQDKANGVSSPIDWHDEGYFNAFLYRNIDNINSLPGINFCYPVDVFGPPNSNVFVYTAPKNGVKGSVSSYDLY